MIIIANFLPYLLFLNLGVKPYPYNVDQYFELFEFNWSSVWSNLLKHILQYLQFYSFCILLSNVYNVEILAEENEFGHVHDHILLWDLIESYISSKVNLLFAVILEDVIKILVYQFSSIISVPFSFLQVKLGFSRFNVDLSAIHLFRWELCVTFLLCFPIVLLTSLFQIGKLTF